MRTGCSQSHWHMCMPRASLACSPHLHLKHCGVPSPFMILPIACGRATCSTLHWLFDWTEVPTRCFVPPFAGLAATALMCSRHNGTVPLVVEMRAASCHSRTAGSVPRQPAPDNTALVTGRPVGMQIVGGARHVGQALSRFCRASSAGSRVGATS